MPPDKVRGAARTARRISFGGCGSSEPTFAAYYGGFANEGLWPLCHLVDVRPQFRSEDWAAYQDVNARFAAAIDEELGAARHAGVHPGLPPGARGAARCARGGPTARTALFWHIPWPYPDRLRICPWRREILAGLLANDLLAFQLERDRRNFLLAVEEELDAEVEAESSRVAIRRPRAPPSWPCRSAWTSTASRRLPPIAALADRAAAAARRCSASTAEIIGLGVDRLDYTKGIPERLAALDALLTRRPDLRGRLTFVQIGVPSRSELGKLRADRGGDRPARRRRQRAPRRATACRRRSSTTRARSTIAEPGGALPAGALLHRQLAARRHEPGGQGVRGGARRRGRRAGAERAGRRGAGAATTR